MVIVAQLESNSNELKKEGCPARLSKKGRQQVGSPVKSAKSDRSDKTDRQSVGSMQCNANPLSMCKIYMQPATAEERRGEGERRETSGKSEAHVVDRVHEVEWDKE